MFLRAPDPKHRRASKGQVRETSAPGCRRDPHPDVPAGWKGPEPCSRDGREGQSRVTHQ